ncbi:MAG: hypothetical protein ACT4OQ_03210 [Chloroflexota bacterium]
MSGANWASEASTAAAMSSGPAVPDASIAWEMEDRDLTGEETRTIGT